MQMDDLASTGRAEPLTAREAGLMTCRSCGRLERAAVETCPLCSAVMHSRAPRSVQRVWAWLFAGIILYVPANLYPMLLTRTFGSEQQSTIIGGAVELVLYGSYGVALIVFIASVLIPVGKFVAIGILALGVTRGSRISPKRRMVLYEIVEFIGRWSMIDVFVVAILSALVQLGFVASVNPGPAAICFALSVVFTMLAAQAFDPRLIWDKPTAKMTRAETGARYG